MNMSIEAAALGVVKVVNSAMVRALRRVTVERGIDGRRCVLLAYGGAGPMHAIEVARAFGIAKVIVPVHSSAFSALGCVSAEMSYSQQRTVRMALGDWDVPRLRSVRQSLQARLSAPLEAAGYHARAFTVEEVASIRYRGQSYAIEITHPVFDEPEKLGKAFFEEHEKLYGFVTDEPWELVAIRQRVSVANSTEVLRPVFAGSGRATPIKSTACFFDAARSVATPRYLRSALGAGQTLRGPAVVEDEWSTVIVPPGASLTADRRGHLHIDAGAKP
jgi:N-methylhydantoinase A